MSRFTASLRLAEETGPGIGVLIDLGDERIAIRAGDIEIGDWPLDAVRVSAAADGFRLQAEGEMIVLDVTEDAEFALELGLRSAPPLLRRRMAAHLRDR